MYKMVFAKAESPILDPANKLGGNPVGLDDIDWPSCKTCNSPMAFLMQLLMGPNDPLQAVDDRMLYLFICNNPEMRDQCQTKDPNMGDNAVVVVSFDEMLEGVAEIPEESNGMAAEYSIELRETAWPAKCGRCGRPVGEGELACPDCSNIHELYSRIGGPLSWLHPEEAPFDHEGKPMEFAALLDWDVKDAHLNMSQIGVGYLFLSADKKTGKFLYQV